MYIPSVFNRGNVTNWKLRSIPDVRQTNGYVTLFRYIKILQAMRSMKQIILFWQTIADYLMTVLLILIGRVYFP